MKIQARLEDISDGRLYTSNDMVKAGTNNCRDCCWCCQGMGSSVVLDPYDMWKFHNGLGKSLQELVEEGFLELNEMDGVIRPNVRMAGEEKNCVFLNAQGRCSIYENRPGLCRLFPLARIYEGYDFRYILQIYDCPHCGQKVKIKKFLSMPDLKSYEKFELQWHYFLEGVEHLLEGSSDSMRKRVNEELLELFFGRRWAAEDFYGQFERRLSEARQVLGLAESSR